MNVERMRGVYVVEFAIIGVLMFVLVLGVIEFGRLFFTVNALNEAARRGARLAAVCDIKDPHILHRALFNEAGDGGLSSLVASLHEDNLFIDYLNGSGGVVPAPKDYDGSDGFRAVRFVRLSLRNFEFKFLVPVGLSEILAPDSPKWKSSLTLPEFQSTIPRESLGRHPEGAQPYDTAPGVTPC